MNYSDDPAMVRVDFFKESGKWYATEAVKWLQYCGKDIHTVFQESLREHFSGSPRTYRGLIAVCLKPYHNCEHPLMTREW